MFYSISGFCLLELTSVSPRYKLKSVCIVSCLTYMQNGILKGTSFLKLVAEAGIPRQSLKGLAPACLRSQRSVSPSPRSPCIRRWKASCRRASTSSWTCASSPTSSSCGPRCSRGCETSLRSCTVITWSTTRQSTREREDTPSKPRTDVQPWPRVQESWRMQDSDAWIRGIETRGKSFGVYIICIAFYSYFFTLFLNIFLCSKYCNRILKIDPEFNKICQISLVAIPNVVLVSVQWFGVPSPR